MILPHFFAPIKKKMGIKRLHTRKLSSPIYGSILFSGEKRGIYGKKLVSGKLKLFATSAKT
jgi:hypothetical protein